MKKRILIILVATTWLSILFIVATAPFQPTFMIFDNLSIMKNLNSDETKAVLGGMLDRTYNFTELYRWEHEKIKFVTNETFDRSTNPLRILEIGKGRCGEFSILYVALCLAQGYQTRLVLAVDVSPRVFWLPQHEWAEVRVGYTWVHVDPSDQVWNQSSHYKTWSWANGIGSNIRMYAFEDRKFADVTASYKAAIIDQ